MTDIRLVFTTDAQLEEACAKLAQFKAAGRLPDGVSDEEMWRARQVRRTSSLPAVSPYGPDKCLSLCLPPTVSLSGRSRRRLSTR